MIPVVTCVSIIPRVVNSKVLVGLKVAAICCIAQGAPICFRNGTSESDFDLFKTQLPFRFNAIEATVPAIASGATGWIVASIVTKKNKLVRTHQKCTGL